MTGRARWRWLAVILLVAATGRVTSALACLLPCDVSPVVADDGGTLEHCASPFSPESDRISEAGGCGMSHAESDPAVRATERPAPPDSSTAHLFAPGAPVAWADGPAGLIPAAFRGPHAPPGKPRPLRV